MSKKCIHCGAELAEDASFCPHCATEQTDKKTVDPPPKKHTKAIGACIGVVLIAVIVCLVMVNKHKPQTYEGSPTLLYTDDGTTYRLSLTYSSETKTIQSGASNFNVSLSDEDSSALPSQLYVLNEETGELAWSDFIEKVETYSVETVPLDNASAMNFTDPTHSEYFPSAAYESDIIFTTDCGTNEIWWTLQMKNGDTIRLMQTISVTRLQTVTYDSGNTPLSTSAELQTLLDTIASDVDSETVVILYLPAVTYDEPAVLDNHTYMIFGSTDDDGNQTTFTDEFSYQAEGTNYAQIDGITFSHAGGTGLNVYKYTMVSNCTFKGCSIGALGSDGSWLNTHDCTFEGNDIGLKFDSDSSTGANENYSNNEFRQNSTAILINGLPGDLTLDFIGSTFSGNDTDIDNPADYPLDTTNAVFE